MTKDQKEFINHVLSELEAGDLAIFAGAGLSAPAGYVNWKELLKPLAHSMSLDINKEHDLVSIAQFYTNQYGRQRLSQQLTDKLAKSKQPTKNHKILSKLPINTYWTTNYDKLIESSLSENHKICDVKYTVNQLSIAHKRRDAVVYKMHGDIDHPDHATITKDDYERYSIDMQPYIIALSDDLVSKTFIFLGFSFRDPNLDYIMSRVKAYFHEHQRMHYCIFKECSENDFYTPEDFKNEKNKQKLLIEDLRRFKIKTVLVKEYSEITDMLSLIEKRLKQKTIFLSGSASCFSPFDQAQVESFLVELGSQLIKNGYKISSGIGLGIGNAFITGAIQGVYRNHGSDIDKHISMKPFPQHIPDKQERERVWGKYRKEIIEPAGIAIFFMGNKFNDENHIINADGVRKEFEIAKQLGLTLIPVGCSGFMAKELWQQVIENISDYYDENNEELTNAIMKLGNDVEQIELLIQPILNILNLISKE